MAYALPDQCDAYMNAMQIHKYLDDVWHVIGEANAYIDAQAPWKLKKEDPERMETVLYVLAEVIRCVTIMAQPIVPNGTAKILDQLSIEADKRDFSHLNTDNAVQSGTELPTPQGVFPRLDLDKEKAA
jgi:methionyl-tRNA synthetase